MADGDVVVLDEPATAGDAVDTDVVVVAPEGDDTEALPESAELQPDGSVVLALRFPVVMRWKRQNSDQIREERTEVLHMHRLNGASVRAITAAGAGHTVVTGLARSCRMEQGRFNALYDRMDGSDATAAARVLSFFLSPGAPTPTGPRSSPS